MGISIGGSKKKEQEKSDAPDWARGYMADVASRVGDEVQKEYTPYTGQRQAGFNADQQSAFDLYRNQASGSPEFQAGSSLLREGIGQQGPANPFFGRYTPQLEANNLALMSSERVSNPFLTANSPNASNTYIGATSKGVSGAPSVLDYAMRGQALNSYIGMTTRGITDVPTVSTGSNAMLGMDNPFLNKAIDNVAGDISRNYNLTTAPQLDSMARASGSFGNTGVDQMRLESQRNLAKEIGNAATGMRMQDYNLQANLGEQDLNRRMQAGQINAGNALDAQRFNSGLQSQDIARNLAGYAAQTNQNFGNVLDAAKFDAANSLASQQFNASLGNNDLTRNANLLQDLAKFNVGNQVGDVRQLQNLTNSNLQFNAANANDASRFNASNSNDFAKFNATLASNDIGRNADIFDRWSGSRNGMLNTALNYDSQRSANAGGLLDVGNSQQNYDQTGLDLQYKDWLDQQNWNRNNLDWGASVLAQLARGYGEGSRSGSGRDWRIVSDNEKGGSAGGLLKLMGMG